ncbi:MAG TPA: acetyl/propionyl-CoA carboxylase subunit alpha, partial [Alphaproteobacteria bacterium]|nr:acetyl/propionyl-CoA carboxylase subunit alpha [Alphaproteobacteria bacterium]
THAATREAAIAAMGDALDEFYIRGIQHNIPFVSAVMSHPRFREGRLTTAFIDEEYPDGFQGAELGSETRRELAAIAGVACLMEKNRARQISGQIDKRYQTARGADWVVTLDGENYPVELAMVDGKYHVLFEGGDLLVVETDWTPASAVMDVRVADRRLRVQIDRQREGFLLTHGGATLSAVMRTPRAAELYALMPEKVVPDMSKYLLCPMPGLVISIPVEVG